MAHNTVTQVLLASLTLLPLVGCGELIDESGDPLDVGAQRRTVVDVPCDDDEAGCPLAIESAESRDDGVIDVTDFGDGFVEVEAVGEGKTKVIAKGDGKRVRIKYAIESTGNGSDDLEVITEDIEVLSD